MNNFDFCSPTHFVFGKDREMETGSYVKKYGGSRVLVHFGGQSAKKSGLLERVTASLEKEQIEYTLLGGVKPNPRSGLVYEGIELCREQKIDFILAVGGGSVIDSGKLIAHGVFYDGDPFDISLHKVESSKALPIGVILTNSASGSELSTSCVISSRELKIKKGFNSELNRPLFAIENPELTYSLNLH